MTNWSMMDPKLLRCLDFECFKEFFVQQIANNLQYVSVHKE